MSTTTGFNWLTDLLSKQAQWFYDTLNGWIERINGSDDHSGDFCNPFYYPLAAIIGIAKFFCAAITTFCCWPGAMAKDLMHLRNDPKAAISSLLCVTPVYVIIMTILNLLASIGCIVLFVALLILVIFVALYFGLRYLFGKCVDGVGTVVGCIFKTASR